jgi:transketolase C-terminal domain/subunit
VLRQSPQDRVTVIGAVVTLHEALKSADQLKAEGTAVRVIDLYCVKPIDGKELGKEIATTGGRLISVEDHRADGGIGEAVLSALAQVGVALLSRSSSRCGRCPTLASRMSSLTPSAFRRNILWRRSAQFHSKPRRPKADKGV